MNPHYLCWMTFKMKLVPIWLLQPWAPSLDEPAVRARAHTPPANFGPSISKPTQFPLSGDQTHPWSDGPRDGLEAIEFWRQNRRPGYCCQHIRRLLVR